MPQTEQGAELWAAVSSSSGVFRYVGMVGCVGLDWPLVLELAEIGGVSRAVTARLLPYLEAGLADALAEDKDNG
jgi:hypothetical protein